jgi:pyridoxal phosphate enzyme (YggS family)
MLIGTHSERVEGLRARIKAAALRAGRDPASVTLVAVGKGHPAAALQAARASGITDFGESYVQEALEKMDALGNPPGVTWHFIGRLQSNKTRAVAGRFDWVHGVDRLQIAHRLSAQRPSHARPLNVCLQVRVADESTKGGVAPDDLPLLAAEVARLERLKLRGLMCLPPESQNTDTQRSWFRQLRTLLETLNQGGLGLDTLSMGMSGDFESAVEEGATHIRIGTALFGERPSGEER